jgi:hypothetical protein
MYFNNDKIRDFLQEYFHWSNEQLAAMMNQYYGTVDRMMINDCIDFLEQKNPPEKAMFEQLLRDKESRRTDPAVEAELLQFLVKLPGIYPELEASIKNRVAELDESLLKDTFASLDEPAAIKVLEMINQDLDNMQNFAEKYLVKKPQSP